MTDEFVVIKAVVEPNPFEALSALLDDELPREEKRRTQNLLGRARNLKKELAQFKRTDALLREWAEHASPEDYSTALRCPEPQAPVFRYPQPTQPEQRERRLSWRRLSAVAAAVVLFGFFLAGRTSTPQGPSDAEIQAAILLDHGHGETPLAAHLPQLPPVRSLFSGHGEVVETSTRNILGIPVYLTTIDDGSGELSIYTVPRSRLSEPLADAQWPAACENDLQLQHCMWADGRWRYVAVSGSNEAPLHARLELLSGSQPWLF